PAVRGEGHVDVGVDQAGKDGRRPELPGGGLGEQRLELGAPPHGGEPAVLDHHASVLEHPAAAVEQVPGEQRRPAHAGTPTSASTAAASASTSSSEVYTAIEARSRQRSPGTPLTRIPCSAPIRAATCTPVAPPG